MKYSFRLDIDEETMADIMAMAENVAGRPGDRVAGLCALIAEWRRLKTEHEARLEWASCIMRQEEKLDALDHRADAEGR